MDLSHSIYIYTLHSLYLYYIHTLLCDIHTNCTIYTLYVSIAANNLNKLSLFTILFRLSTVRLAFVKQSPEIKSPVPSATSLVAPLHPHQVVHMKAFGRTWRLKRRILATLLLAIQDHFGTGLTLEIYKF